jgi:hypothetical protein
LNEPDEALRRLIATEYGLEPEAATFLIGSSVEELEQSAAQLAALLGKEREPEREPSFIEQARVAKAERKRQLTLALTGRAQPRGDRGRWASTASFGGGARTPLPAQRETHEQTLTRVLRTREADAGATF